MLKDERLSQLAKSHNVARFVSFDDSLPSPQIRHSVPSVSPHGRSATDPNEAIGYLLKASRHRTVNVRTFYPDGPRRQGKFTYGLDRLTDVWSAVLDAARNGCYSIVNETIDTHDGGVSGVYTSAVSECAPDATPRVVERGDTFGGPSSLVAGVLDLIYGVDSRSVLTGSERLEFSVHPGPEGSRNERIIIWEASAAPREISHRPSVEWPNDLSRVVGDKAFGLVVAEALGVPVPLTTVVPRRVAPFTFGDPTGVGNHWIRTCPREPVPGKWPTFQGWRDPYRLLADIDPRGDTISSLISQESVQAAWSGAAMLRRIPLTVEVEGVSGFGDDFMLGRATPEDLPPDVVTRVERVLQKLSHVLGDVRMEWADDGSRVWVLQLHRVRSDINLAVPRANDDWIPYDPASGIDLLYSALDRAIQQRVGVIVTARVGATSHIGEILAGSAVPWSFA